jgi:perosamine synthetase
MIPLIVPNLSGNEARYLQECIASNFVSSVGPFVTRFEDMVAQASGAKAAIATASGTAGLHVALVAANVRRDDLVILPSFTFIASANAISQAGASPWLLDIDERSWTLDALILHEHLKQQTRRNGDDLVHVPSGRRVGAIMPVYTLGNVPDMEAIGEIARIYRLPLIADAAAALGATYQNKSLSELADLSVFSFYGNKTVTAGGGGAVVGSDEALLKKVRHLSTTARVGRDYHHDVAGYNYRMTNLQAAVGCAQMERLEEFVGAKRRIRRKYNEGLSALPGVGLFPEPSWGESACWFSGVTVQNPRFDIATLCQRLQEKEIEARSFWKPMHLQPPYAESPRSEVSVADRIWGSILTLPCATGLSETEQQTVIDSVFQILR